MTLGAFLSTHTIEGLLDSYGYLVVFLLVMIESIGVPVPGETALIVGALYAGSTGKLEIWAVIAAAIAGAIIGDNIGFSIGRYGGSKLLLRHGHRIRLARGTAEDRDLAVPPPRRQGRLLGPLRLDPADLGGLPRRSEPHALAALPRLQRRRRRSSGPRPSAWLYYVFGDVLKQAEHDDRRRRSA